MRSIGRVQRLLTVTIMLAVLAAVNVTFITWAKAQDCRHAAAITSVLGATGSACS